MSKFYVLSFDPHKTDAAALHTIIKGSPLVKNWSHYLGSTYVLLSPNTAEEITDYIIEKWPNNRFFVSELNISNHNGWMTLKQWEWIKKHR